MALGTTRSFTTIKPNVKKGTPTIHLKECDATGTALTTGDGTVWTAIGTTINTTLIVETTPTQVQDDTGANVVDSESITTAKLTFDLPQRDSATRNLFENADGKFYQVFVIGAETSSSTVEAHALAIGKIAQAVNYTIGSEGRHTGVEIRTIQNSASVSITGPTAYVTGTVTVNKGRMHGTGDVTFV